MEQDFLPKNSVTILTEPFKLIVLQELVAAIINLLS